MKLKNSSKKGEKFAFIENSKKEKVFVCWLDINEDLHHVKELINNAGYIGLDDYFNHNYNNKIIR
jgi:hypothetical protein